MENKYKRLNLRFNLYKEEQANLLKYLKSIAAKRHESLNAAIIDLLLSIAITDDPANNTNHIFGQNKKVFTEELDPRTDGLKACKSSSVFETSAEESKSSSVVETSSEASKSSSIVEASSEASKAEPSPAVSNITNENLDEMLSNFLH